MKKIKIFFLLCLFGMISNAANAEVVGGECGVNAKWSLDTETGELIISGKGKMSNYTTYSYVPWYNYRKSILSVDISGQITSIGNYAFRDCSNLTSIKIPNSVTSIGVDAFNSCSKLTNVVIDIVDWANNNIVVTAFNFSNKSYSYFCNGAKVEGDYVIPESVSVIGANALRNCKDITSIIIPHTVTSIGNYAFYECSGLINVDIPNSVISIGDDAFGLCSDLTSVEIPNSVVTIGDYAFDGCTGLINVVIPNSVTSIGTGVFSNCSGLISVVIGKSVISIGGGAFQYCSGLTNVTIGNSVTSIGDNAFRFCTGLTSVLMPNSVTSIGSFAFYNCSSLTSVVMPHTVASIGDCAFMGCSRLTSVNVDIVDWMNENSAVTTSGLSGILLSYFYKGVKVEGDYVIPNDITVIGTNALRNCKDITSITISKSVISIGNNAFYGCSGLTSAVISSSVTSIGESAFYECSGLTNIEIPYSVTSIENNAFYGCSFEKIEYYAKANYSSGFTYLSSLKEVIIGDSMTILNTKFSNCKNLSKVTLGKSLQYIRQEIFSGCVGLTEVHSRAENPPYLYPNAFYNVPFSSATLYVPHSAKASYSEADTWKEFGTIVSDTPDPVDQQLNITVSNYGKVLYAGKEITNTTWSGKVEQGEKLTFTFVANQGCHLQKVTMNNVNVTKYIEDNMFTVDAVESDITMNVTFEKEDLFLTVKTSEGTEEKIDAEPGKQYTLVLSSYADNIESVTFNGEDVTSEVKDESDEKWWLVVKRSDTGQVTYQVYTTPAITESSDLYIKYKVNHPKGDTNEDGTVDVADITATASIILTGKAKEEEDLE